MPPAPKKRPASKLSNVKIIVVLAAGTAAYLGWIYRPVEREISALRDEIGEQRQLMEQALLLPAQVDRLRDETQRTTRYVSAWQESSRPETARMFGGLSLAIAASGARTTHFQPEPKHDRNYLREVAVRVTCRGTLQQLFTSLGALEGLPWTVWLDEVRLSPDKENQAILSCELKLAIFTEKSDHSD